MSGASQTSSRLHYFLDACEDGPPAAGGMPIVDICGCEVPEELVIAAGAQPRAMLLRLDEPTPLADLYLDAEEDPAMRSLLQQLCAPRAPRSSLAILGPPHAQLASVIEEIRATGEIRHAAPSWYHELLAIRSDANRRFAIERTAALATRLESLAGIAPKGERLQAAIALTNARRAAIRQFNEARRTGRVISGNQAFRILLAARRLPCADYTAALHDLVKTLDPDPALADRPRTLLLPSGALGHFRAHDAIEQGGALIVAEDDPSGARAGSDPVPETGDPLVAVAEHGQRNCTGQRVYPREDRLRWILEQAAQPDIDLVVIYAESPHFGWDFPGIREALQAHAKPLLIVRQDTRTAEGFAAAVRDVASFVEAMPGGKQ